MVLLFVFQSTAFGGERRLALVRRIQGIEQIPQGLSKQLEILTMQVVAKQPDYELLLSGTDTPTASVVDMVAVESEVGRSKDGYRIEARLLDIRTKKLLTKASHDNIREEDLIRLFQGALESLFIPDEKNKKPSEKTVTPPKTTNVPRIRQILPTTTHVKEPDAPSLDFKKLIRDLKINVDKEIEKKSELQAIAAREELAKKKAAENAQSLMVPRSLISSKDAPANNPTAQNQYKNRYNVQLGWDSRNIDSSYLVDTSVKAQFLTLKSAGHLPLDFLRGQTAFSYDVGMSRALSIPIEAPVIYQLGLYGTWLQPRYNLSAGLNRDASFFVNLPSPGAGLAASSITTTWLSVKSEINFDLKGKWELTAKYGVPGMVETDYSPLKSAKQWQGNNLQLTATPPLGLKSWNATLLFEQINLTSQGDAPFTLNESRTALFVRRSL